MKQRQSSDSSRIQSSSPTFGFGLDVCCDLEAETTVLRRELAAVPDDPFRAALLLYELGRMALAAGHEVEAAQYLLRAYSQRPEFRPTLHLARFIYKSRGDSKLVLKLFDAEARATRDPLTRANLLRQQARVLWSFREDTATARERLEAALTLDSADLTSLRLIELIFAQTQDADGRIMAIQRQLQSITDERIRAALHVDAALLQAPTDAPAAVKALTAAREEDPESISALLFLEQVFEEADEYQQLADILAMQANMETVESPWRARLLARAARIHRDRLGSQERAIQLFAQSIGADPQLGPAFEHFELLTHAKRYREAVDVGDGLALLALDDSLFVPLTCEIGDICRFELDDSAGAIHWYQRCLERRASYQPALEGLSSLLEQKGDIATLLEVQHRDLAETEDGLERAQRLYRIADILERNGREADALEAHREAVTNCPTFRPSIAALERLLTRSERWTELLRLYDEQTKQEEDPDRYAYLLETAASIWYHHLDSIENALECYQRIITHCPENLRIIFTAARLCDEAQRWQDLVQLYERGIALTGDAQTKAELLQRAGEVWEDRLFDRDQAIECYRRALDCHPGYLPSLRALGRLFRQKGRWEDLIEMHQAESQVSVDPDHAVSLLFTVADVYEDELLNEDAAAETYQEVLNRKPDSAEASNALQRILQRNGRWQEMARLLDGAVDTTDNNREKATLLWRIAELYDSQLGEPNNAARDYLRALRVDPEYQPARSALAQLLERTGDTERLVDLLTATLERSRDATERAGVAHRLGELNESATRHSRRAALLYERSLQEQSSVSTLWRLSRLYRKLDMPQEQCRVLELLVSQVKDRSMSTMLQAQLGRIKHEAALDDPSPHYVTVLGLSSGRGYAQRLLERYLRGTTADEHRDAQIANLIEARIDLTKDPLELACLWTELGETYRRAGDDSGAEQAFRAAIDQAHGHLTAFAGLRDLLRDQGRWTELLDLATTEADSVQSPRSAVDCLLDAAQVAEEQLGDTDHAVRLFRRVLKLEPPNSIAYERLHAIYVRGADWTALASLIRVKITAMDDSLLQARLLEELGRIYLEYLAQPQKGEACLRRVVALDPNNLYALRALGDGSFQRGEWAKARLAYARAEQICSEPSTRRQLLQQLGRTCRAMGNHSEALDALQRALAEQGPPDAQLLREIAEAAASAGDAYGQTAALEQLGEISSDAGERISARKRAAQLAEEHLQDSHRAIGALQEVLALDPLDMEAVERLATAYQRLGNRSAANQQLHAALSHHRASLAQDPRSEHLYHQIARIFRRQNRHDHFYCACVVLDYLRSLSEIEARFMRDHHPQHSSPETMKLDLDSYQRLLLPANARGPIRDLLKELEPSLSKLCQEKPSSYGLTRSNRATAKTALLKELPRLAESICGTEFQLWVSSRQPNAVMAKIFSRPALVVGEHIASNPLGPAERFRLGRALFLLSEPAVFLQDRSVRDLKRLFEALALIAQPQVSLPPTQDDEQLVRALANRLARLVPRKQRRTLAKQLPKVLSDLTTGRLSQYARALTEGANRVGLLLAGDAVTGLREAAHMAAELQSDELDDILQFMVSEEHFALRQQLDLAIPEELLGHE